MWLTSELDFVPVPQVGEARQYMWERVYEGVWTPIYFIDYEGPGPAHGLTSWRVLVPSLEDALQVIRESEAVRGLLVIAPPSMSGTKSYRAGQVETIWQGELPDEENLPCPECIDLSDPSCRMYRRLDREVSEVTWKQVFP